jgi:hypothetical protein
MQSASAPGTTTVLKRRTCPDRRKPGQVRDYHSGEDSCSLVSEFGGCGDGNARHPGASSRRLRPFSERPCLTSGGWGSVARDADAVAALAHVTPVIFYRSLKGLKRPRHPHGPPMPPRPLQPRNGISRNFEADPGAQDPTTRPPLPAVIPHAVQVVYRPRIMWPITRPIEITQNRITQQPGIKRRNYASGSQSAPRLHLNLNPTPADTRASIRTRNAPA